MSDEKPQRIQRSRKAGWRMPDGAVYVGRPSKWGNPFPILNPRCYPTRASLVSAYRAWLEGHCSMPGGPERAQEARRELQGKTLACWCPLDQPCHADVLLEIANARRGGPRGGA